MIQFDLVSSKNGLIVKQGGNPHGILYGTIKNIISITPRCSQDLILYYRHVDKDVCISVPPR